MPGPGRFRDSGREPGLARPAPGDRRGRPRAARGRRARQPAAPDGPRRPQRQRAHAARPGAAVRLRRGRDQPLRDAGGRHRRAQVRHGQRRRARHRRAAAPPAGHADSWAGKGDLDHWLPRAARLWPGGQLDRAGAERGRGPAHAQLFRQRERRPDLGAARSRSRRPPRRAGGRGQGATGARRPLLP